MNTTLAQPTIYEIDTPVFLREIGERVGHPITLAEVPDDEWDNIARPGIDTVWFMGVWKRSQIAKDMAKDEAWLKDALPDMKQDDLLGSAYSIKEYVVDELLGGNEALIVARAALRARGIRLILDYVPNHVAIDNVWVVEHSDYFLSGSEQELLAHPEAFVRTASGIFAKGKDPNYAPWSDVLQLNAFSSALREQAASTLRYIADMCDGVRCDMAMLMMNTIFTGTWGERAGVVPKTEYWPGVIEAVRSSHPDFLFLAEVYWNKQQELLDQGFDLCYDKDLYDYLVAGSVPDINRHLQKPASYQQHLLRFIENHDEERAAHTFPIEKHIAAAVITATLPGAHLYYDGEREGRQVKLPVHLGRRVDEPEDERLSHFYDNLWAFALEKNSIQTEWQKITTHSGLWRRESQQVLAWSLATATTRFIIAINYSPEKATVGLAGNLKGIHDARNIVDGVVNASEYISGSKIILNPWQHIILELKK